MVGRLGCRSINKKWASGGHTVKHDGRRLQHLGHVPRLFLELADGRLLGRLALVDEPGGDLDDDLVQRRAELLLEDNFRAYITEGESGPG